MGMGMKSLKWDGFGTKNLFTHIYSSVVINSTIREREGTRRYEMCILQEVNGDVLLKLFSKSRRYIPTLVSVRKHADHFTACCVCTVGLRSLLCTARCFLSFRPSVTCQHYVETAKHTIKILSSSGSPVSSISKLNSIAKFYTGKGTEIQVRHKISIFGH